MKNGEADLTLDGLLGLSLEDAITLRSRDHVGLTVGVSGKLYYLFPTGISVSVNNQETVISYELKESDGGLHADKLLINKVITDISVKRDTKRTINYLRGEENE